MTKINSVFASQMKRSHLIPIFSRTKIPQTIKKPFHKKIKKTSQVHVHNFSLIQEINVVNRLILLNY